MPFDSSALLAQVKTSALLVLLLISAQDSEGAQKVLDAGAMTITLHEMLSLAGSWSRASETEVPAGQLSGSVGHTAPQSKTSEAATQEVMASAPFMTAGQALLYCLSERARAGDMATFFGQAFTFKAGVVALAFSLSTSNWEMRPEPAAGSHSFATRAQQWWSRQSSIVLVLKSYLQFLSSWNSLLSSPSMGLDRMLHLADTIKRDRQDACRVMDSKGAIGAENIVRFVTTLMDTSQIPSAKSQLERDTLVRS